MRAICPLPLSRNRSEVEILIYIGTRYQGTGQVILQCQHTAAQQQARHSLHFKEKDQNCKKATDSPASGKKTYTTHYCLPLSIKQPVFIQVL
jgi:hypothetical protein